MRIVRCVLSLVALAGCVAPAFGQAADAAKFAPIKLRMQQFVDSNELSGAVTLVGRKDGIVHHEAVGSLDLASKTAMPKDALFRIASMTKPITAMAIMILADEGKLSPEDPVEKYLPEFKGQMLIGSRGKESMSLTAPKRPITLRDLLTHTSGLPGGYPAGLGNVYGKRDRTLNETTLVISQRPLEFEPGTKWSYCNTGIDVLGRIVEVVSGMDYEMFLQTRVFDPLGMKNTTFYPHGAQLKKLATTYGRTDGKLVPAAPGFLDPSPKAKHPIPAGGLCASAEDLAKLYRCLLNHGELNGKRVISEKSLETMTKTQTGDIKTGFVDGMSFGFGFAVVKEPLGVTAMLSPGTYGHGGAFGTQGWIDPKQDVFLILLIARTGLPNGDASVYRKTFQELAVNAIKK